MDSIDRDMLTIWKRELAETKKLLAAVGAANAPRRLTPGEISLLDQEANRLTALILAYEASLNV